MPILAASLIASQSALICVGANEAEIRLDNGIVVAVISPETGRVIFFGKAGGENLLWMNPDPTQGKWINHGGDRVLFSPQCFWPQIRDGGAPDPAAVSRPWEVVEHSSLSVLLRSSEADDLGVRMTRRITLSPDQPDLTQTYRLERIASNPFPVHVWTIAQVRATGSVWMGVREDSVHPKATGYSDLLRTVDPEIHTQLLENETVLKFDWPQHGVSKVGTFGHWLAWLHGDSGLMIAAEWKKGLPYIDKSNLQVFVDPENTRMIELETQSPSTMLAAGESIEHEVRWHLLDIAAGSTDEEIARQLNDTSNSLLP